MKVVLTWKAMSVSPGGFSCNEDKDDDARKASYETTAIEKTSTYVSSRRSCRTDNFRTVRTYSHREAVHWLHCLWTWMLAHNKMLSSLFCLEFFHSAFNASRFFLWKITIYDSGSGGSDYCWHLLLTLILHWNNSLSGFISKHFLLSKNIYLEIWGERVITLVSFHNVNQRKTESDTLWLNVWRPETPQVDGGTTVNIKYGFPHSFLLLQLISWSLIFQMIKF